MSRIILTNLVRFVDQVSWILLYAFDLKMIGKQYVLDRF